MHMSMKRMSRVFACAAAAALLSFVLASCGGDGQQKSPAQLNREYMASVNTISAEAADSLSSFNAAVSEGDLAAMRLSASDAAKKLEKISEMTAPEPLAQVHEEYKAGVNDLTAALSEYIEAYAALQSSADAAAASKGSTQTSSRNQAPAPTVDTETFASQVANSQARYDSGMAHLAKADSMVAELAGGEAPAKDEASEAQGEQPAEEQPQE